MAEIKLVFWHADVFPSALHSFPSMNLPRKNICMPKNKLYFSHVLLNLHAKIIHIKCDYLKKRRNLTTERGFDRKKSVTDIYRDVA
jgi:hypothetical protein